NDEALETFEDVAQVPLIDPRMGRVRGEHPKPADLSSERRFEDLVVSEARDPRNTRLVDAQQRGHLAAIVRAREVAPTEQVRGVAEQARAHRVALAGDGVGARAG